MAAPPLNGATALSVVFKVWSEDLQLDSLRPKMEDQGLKIAEFQEDSIKARRSLAEATKEFKRSLGEASVKGLAPLLKMYQEEIDRLTKRAKHGEAAFLDLYQRLYEAPDPAPALAAALEAASRAADAEAQARKLGAELAEYKAEAASIKNQDLTIRRLEEKVRGLEAALEERAAQIAEAEAAADARADAAAAAHAAAREAELASALAEAQASLATMQRLHTASQNQLFALQSRGEEVVASRQVELELASVELERAQERLMALEREKATLQARLAGGAPRGPNGGDSGGAGSTDVDDGDAPPAATAAGPSIEEALRTELHMQRELAGRLRLEALSLRRDQEDAQAMWEARLEGARDSLAAAEAHAHALEQELAARPTNRQVEELRAQIRLLQAVSYHMVEEDAEAEEDGVGGDADGHGGEGPAGPGAGGRAHLPSSLEAALLQKNRHLEHELTMARLRLVDGQVALEAVTAQLTEAQAQLSEQQALVERLEQDLLDSRKAWGGGGEAAAAAGGEAGLANGQQGGRAQLAGLLDDADGSGGPRRDGGDAGGDGGESSVVRVVCGQRDRLRVKVTELEEEVVRLKAELGESRNAAAAAKADNIALVERLRYVHGFKAQPHVGAGGVGLDVEVGADVERRYGRLYDEQINPFKQFQGEQRERQKSNLHFADRLMYSFGQLVFSSTRARLGTFAYLVVLHLLVFSSMMHMTHHSSSALVSHHQAVLGAGRHAAMDALHHVGAPSGEIDPRLP